MLRAQLATCRERAVARTTQPPADPGVVESLWRDFADLGPLEPHADRRGRGHTGGGRRPDRTAPGRRIAHNLSVRTSVTELLRIERPILQAPMASVATPELAVAVSEAGGLGALGSAVLSPDELRQQAAQVRAGTDRPFQLNFFCHEAPSYDAAAVAAARESVAPLYGGEPPEAGTPGLGFDEERLAALLEISPPVASFHFGLPDAAAVAACRGAGITILASATTVSEARRLEELGADAVIAQGAEAGGHRGSFLVPGDDGPVGTLALVPQVVDAVRLPVIAAGGIADGRGLAAVLTLGAGAAQLGTAFVAASEGAAPAAYRRALRERPAEETTLSRNFSGRPARALRNRITDELDAPLPYPAQLSLTAPLRDEGPGTAAMWAGQAAPLAREGPAAEIVERIMAEAEHALRRPPA